MKKLSVLIFCLLMTGGVAMADFIDHPRYAQINTFTASVVSQIADKQDEFFITNGKYFQGIWLLGDVQVDGTEDYDIINTAKPDDQEFTWSDFDSVLFKKNVKIPVNIKIDVYQRYDGWGWVFTAECWIEGYGPDAYGHDGSHWVYVHHEGPRTFPGIQDEWIIIPDN